MLRSGRRRNPSSKCRVTGKIHFTSFIFEYSLLTIAVLFRSDVRCVAMSSDGLQIASCSSDGVRIWSSVTFQCLRRCATGYGVSLVFAPGGRYVIVGTREGRLQVILGTSSHHIPLYDGRAILLPIRTGATKKYFTQGILYRLIDCTSWRFVLHGPVCKMHSGAMCAA